MRKAIALRSRLLKVCSRGLNTGFNIHTWSRLINVGKELTSCVDPVQGRSAVGMLDPFESPCDNWTCTGNQVLSFFFIIASSVRRTMWCEWMWSFEINALPRRLALCLLLTLVEEEVCIRSLLLSIWANSTCYPANSICTKSFNDSSFTYKRHFLKSKSGGSPQIVLGMMWLLLREAPSEGLVKVVVFSTHNHGCNYYWRWQEVSSRFYQKANFDPIHSAHL